MKFRVEIVCDRKDKPGAVDVEATAVLHVDASCIQHAIVNALHAASAYGFQPRYAIKAELKAGLFEEIPS